jgi:hypothetical protein
LSSLARAEPTGVAGRDGVHTGDLARLLDELQGLARTEPEAVW